MKPEHRNWLLECYGVSDMPSKRCPLCQIPVCVDHREDGDFQELVCRRCGIVVYTRWYSGPGYIYPREADDARVP
jgi:endogenous inhibitor of DNA gyrase (YacG/DUF329 family)